MKIIFSLIIISFSVFAQVPNPQFGSFNPTYVSPNQFRPSSYGSQTPSSIHQKNREIMRRMGMTPPPTDAEIKASIRAMAEMGERSEEVKEYEQVSKVASLLKKIYIIESQKPDNYWQSTEYKNAIRPFEQSRDFMKEMLTGKRTLSIKEAYFALESAYGDMYLDRSQFERKIQQSVVFIRQWMLENNLDIRSNQDIHEALQRFMADTLYIKGVSKSDVRFVNNPTGHLPFYYDYIDNRSEKDTRNYHVSKTLATGTGQCHTLPSVYLILAEALGAEVYLSYAPVHSFIKFRDSQGTIHNYEATSDWLMSDQFYMKDLHIRTEAIRSRLYLDTLNTQQIVAACLIDLAWFHNKRYGTADGRFVNSCVDFALNYFPNKANEAALQLKSGIYANELLHLLSKNGIYDLKDLDDVQGARALYNKIVANEDYLRSLGYQPIPEEAYEAMLQRHDKKGRWQIASQIQTKEKRNLFFQQ